MMLRMFIRSAYVSCIFCSLRISSSCAATLRRRRRRLSVLSSPLRTRSITSLNRATLRAYACTAASGLSFVESSWTASRASSRALVRARRDDGLCSERSPLRPGRSGGSGWRRLSEPDSIRRLEGGDVEVVDWRYDWGGGSERSSLL